MTKTHTFPFTAHVRSSGLTLPPVSRDAAAPGTVKRQGEEFEVTQELYEATLDRYGDSWLDLSEAEQSARWGMVKWAKGPAPEGMGIGQDDEGFRYRQGLAAREYALQISDPKDRAEALKKVLAEYGDALTPVAQTGNYIPASNGY